MAEKTFKEWLDAHHTGIANAIRTKEGSTEKIEPEDFEQRILDLPSGGEVVNAQEKEVKLEYINQSFFPDSGYNYLSKLKINSILTSLKTFTTDNFASIIKQGESILGIEGNYTGVEGISLDVSSVNVDFSELPRSYLDISNLVPNSNKYVRFDNSNGDVNIRYAGKNANIDFTGATGTISLENTGSLVFSGGGLDASKIADGETILGIPGNFKGEGTTVVESIPGVKVGTASIDINFEDTAEGIINANIYEATATSQIKVNGSEYDLVANISQGQVGINGVNTTYSIYDTGESSYVDVASKSPTIDLSGSTGTVTIDDISPELINREKYNITNLSPENIANGVWILGKQGTFKGTSFVTQDKEVESITHLPFTIYPDAAQGGSLPNVMRSVTIRGVSPSIDPYIKPEFITENASILGVQGKAIVPEGNIDILANTPTEKPLNIARYATATVRVPQEGEILKEQRFDGDIDKLPFTLVPDNGFKLTEVIIRGVNEEVGNLKPENIKYGETVLGVDGMFVGSTDVVADGTELNPTKVYGTVNFAFGREYDSVKYILGLLNLAEGEMYYAICDSTMEHYVRIQKTSSDDYQIVIKDGETVIPVFGTNVDGDYKGFFINKYLFTSSFVSSSNVDGTTVGDKNYYLKNIISSTPFVSTKELEVPAPIYPSIRRQEIYSSSTDKVFEHIVVEPVTATIDSNIKKQYIAKDITILGVQGELEAITGITNDSRVITVDYEYAPGNEMVFTNALQTMVIFENTCRDLTIYYDGEDGTFDFSGATGTITLKGDSSNTDVDFVFEGINGGLEGVTGSGTTLTITDSSLWTKVKLSEPQKSISILGNSVTVDLLDANSAVINTLPTSGFVSFGPGISRTKIIDAADISTYNSTSHTITSSDGITLETAGMYCPNNIKVNVDSSLLNGAPGVTVDGSSITIDNSYDTINLNEDYQAKYNVKARVGAMDLTLYNTSLNITSTTDESNTIAINFDSHAIQLKYSKGKLVDILKDGTSIL